MGKLKVIFGPDLVTKQESHRCGSVTKEIKRDQEDVSITVCVHHRLCPTAPMTGII